MKLREATAYKGTPVRKTLLSGRVKTMSHPESQTNVSRALRSATFAALITCIACDVNEDARVTVVYEQIANFGSYSLGSGSAGASPNVFIMYRIRSISNNASDALPYVFDRDNLVTVTNSHTVGDGPLDATQNILLGGQSINSLSVPAGSAASDSPGLGCVIVYAQADDPSDVNNPSALVGLLHTIDPDQPVTMTRARGDTTTAIILGDAVPSAPNVGLQQLCNTGSTLR